MFRNKVLLVILIILGVHWGAFSQCTPVIIGTNPDPANGCEDFTVQFFDNSGCVVQSRTWDFGNGQTSTVQNPIHTFSAGVLGDTTYNVSLTLVDIGGISSSASVPVTVYYRPQASFTASHDTVCALNDLVSFTNTSTFNALYSYDWSFGAGEGTDNNYHTSHIYNSATTHTVTLTVTDTNGCTQSHSENIVVNEIPSPNFQFDNIVGCHPMTVTITNTTVEGTFPITDWSWDFNNPDVSNSTEADPTPLTYEDFGVYAISLTATNSAGCVNTTTNNLFVNETPTAEFVIPEDVCRYDTATAVYTGTGTLAGVYTWEASNNANVMDVGMGPIRFAWDSIEIQTITLTVEENGCESTLTQNIFVNDLPTVELISDTPIDSLCEFQEITFTALPDSFVTFTFFNNDTVLLQQGPENEYLTSSLISPNNISILAVDSNQCASSATNSISITVLPLPIAIVSSGIDTICEGETVTFTATPGFDSYEWFNGFESLADTVSNSISLSNLEDLDMVHVVPTQTGCEGFESNRDTTRVIPPLETPVINCGASTNNEVLFVWEEIDGATGYEIEINSALPDTTVFPDQYVVNGLVPGDTVWASLLAHGLFPCGNSIESDSTFCIAQPCDTMRFTPISNFNNCEGDTATLIISDIDSPSGGFGISWNGEAFGQDTIYAFSPESDTTISVALIDSTQLGCPAYVHDFSITYQQLPDFQLVLNDDTVCEEFDVIIQSSQAGFDQYQFYIDGGLVQDSTYHVYSDDALAPGDHQVVLRVTENSCLLMDTINFFIVETPVAEIVVQPDSVCSGDDFTFVATEGFDSYLFVRPGNGSVLQDSTINTFTTNFTNYYRMGVVGVDVFGCRTDLMIDTVVIKDVPVIDVFTSDVTSQAICIDEPVTFSVYCDEFTYIEFWNNYTIEQVTSDTFYVPDEIDSSHYYYARAILNGCVGEYSDSIDYNVGMPVPTPVVNCGVTGDGQMQFVWDNISSATSYLISVNDQQFITPSSGILGLSHNVFGLTAADTVCVEVLAGSNSPCGNSDISEPACCIMPCDLVDFQLSELVTQVCEGDSVTLSYHTIISPSDDVDVSWNDGPFGDQEEFTFLPTQDTVISLTMMDMSQVSCIPTTKYFHVEFNERPSVTLTGDTILCETDEVILEATPTYYDNYQFLDGFLPIASGLNPNQIDSVVENGHSYSVIATHNGCIDTSNVLTIQVTDALETPDVFCGQTTDNSIQILWDSVPNSQGYEISLNGYPWITPNSGVLGLENNSSGFNTGDTLWAKVRAIAGEPCDYSSESELIMCIAEPCSYKNFDKTFDFDACEGEEVTIEMYNIQTPSSQFAISWDGGLSFSGDSTYTALVTSDTIVSVMLVDSTESLCPATIKDVLISVQETPEVLLLDNFNNDSLCEGEYLQLVADTIGYDGYQFFIDDVLVQDSLFYAFETSTLSPGSHEIKVIATDNNCYYEADSTIFEVVSYPGIILGNSDDNDTICQEEEIIFTATAGFENYSFYINGSLEQSGVNDTYITNQITDGDIVHVVGTNANLCSRFSDSTQIGVIPIPVVNIVSSDADNNICAGDTVEYFIAPMDLDFFNVYLNGDSVFNDIGASFMIDSLEDGDEVYIIGSEMACSDTSNSIFTIVEYRPEAIGNSDTNMVCVGTEVQLSVSGGDSYLWFDGSSDSTMNITASTTTDYTVTTTVGNCTSWNDTITILVDEDIPFADAGMDEVICRGDSIQLFATGGLTYLWLTDSVSNDTIPDPYVSPFDTTLFTVVVTNIYCKDTSDVLILIDRCLTELPDDLPQVVTPNRDGDNDFLVIDDIDYFKENKLTIYNRWSNKVYESSPYNNEWEGTNQRGKPLPDGTYYYVLELGPGFPTYKGFVVIHR